jgi:hypothetical protein
MELAAPTEQGRGQDGAYGDHVLAVVEHEQQLLARQVLAKGLENRLTWSLGQA